MNFLRRSQQAVPHQKLGGRYKVINQLGVGGFSQTFLAQDLHLPGHPLCVVKQFKPQVADPMQLKTASRLFDTEARVLYQLGEHPQIPRLLAHFEEEQEFYLVQEFIEGQPLAKLLTGQAWSEQRVVALLQDLLQVLVFVHQQSVIHRDIKPSNLMYRDHDGRIVLIDFGAVKQVSTQLTESSTGLLTVSIGTQGYMPMEQLSGNPRFSSDIYAAGVVCIQALTGLSPKRFKSDLQTGEIVWRDVRLDPQAGQSSVNPAFAAILDRMVCYHFKDRYQTAEEALQALQALLATQPDLATESEEALAAPDLPTAEQLLTVSEPESSEPESGEPESGEPKAPLAEAESVLPLSPAFDAPTQALTKPHPPVTELVTDPPTETSAGIAGEASGAIAQKAIPFEPETASHPASAAASDPATEAEPIAEQLLEASGNSVFPTAFTPSLDAEAQPDPITSEPLPSLLSDLPSAPSCEIALEEPEAQLSESTPESISEFETVPTTYVAPIVSAAEPSTTWQRSRALPWKLLLGAGLAVVVAVPFFSRFLQPQAQSGINPASLANLPCREPPLPPPPSGEADYEYPDGTRYYGAVNQGLPTDGRAIMVFPSGNRYDGEFQNGQRNGCGTLTFTNGRSYMGQFKDDQFNGQGVWTLETGERYVGSFLDNRCHGEGTFFFADGAAKQGRWQDGKLTNSELQCDQ